MNCSLIPFMNQTQPIIVESFSSHIKQLLLIFIQKGKFMGEEHPNPRNPYLNLSTKLYINLVKLIVSQTFLPNHQEKKLASWGSGNALPTPH